MNRTFWSRPGYQSNSIKEKLKAGKCTVGSWIQIPNGSIAEIMGNSGYDWVAVDMEHGSISLDILPDLLRAIQCGGTVPFVRVAKNDSNFIKQALDAGALGIICPMIETPEDISNFVSWSKYPKEGSRGVGFSRANLFGKDFEEYKTHINENLVLVAQIEHIRGVDSIDMILQNGGVDAIMVGPYDLSASMGITGDFEHYDFKDALKRLKESAKRHGIGMGIHVVQPDIQKLETAIKEDYSFIAYGIDSVFLHSVSKNPNRQV
ncbi:2,4-dihydroxyhept-2-ene-1,7-dioic acid aldolase [Leptospira gomenensis]|uniref:2,4-dihydroxyhept-2-ene-1,7-dioic acid aldolase n=1 Tax=Leptospira gomenensis TaxID=2484974 RepID=A0A5F1Z0R3_9LEPT|nr:aldolase/citrate lyase family protein [Leptospira gomenensis]TGK30922.1 2,4-dihydroxyhept-2-ene-1,7-dioic acid aldolase [Leptospira gomenensis]TGK45358.1 2,4-dihydroxyhept-2-ene-1,7-dioic acid aldolase [Leptospira gomenensis]TGK66271.1 2,4-dihydroxyhept-2-ene-1,7-dioic acid aldolase [Leptospira gomenensis]